jgi:hypothetical protein
VGSVGNWNRGPFVAIRGRKAGTRATPEAEVVTAVEVVGGSMPTLAE